MAGMASAAATLRLDDSTNINSKLPRSGNLSHRELKKRKNGGQKRGKTKTSKAAQNPFNSRSRNVDMEDIEGTYFYTNKCGQLYQVDIGCGSDAFGTDDGDLCMLKEFSVGKVTDSTDEEPRTFNLLLWVHYRRVKMVGSRLCWNLVKTMESHTTLMARNALIPMLHLKSMMMK